MPRTVLFQGAAHATWEPDSDGALRGNVALGQETRRSRIHSTQRTRDCFTRIAVDGPVLPKIPNTAAAALDAKRLEGRDEMPDRGYYCTGCRER